MTADLVLIGGGGHCRSCIDVVTMTGTFSISGILDMSEKKGSFLDSCPYIGTDENIIRLAGEGHQFLVTLGQIKTSRTRYDLFQKLLENDGNLPKIISPLAYPPGLKWGRGALSCTGLHLMPEAGSEKM